MHLRVSPPCASLGQLHTCYTVCRITSRILPDWPHCTSEHHSPGSGVCSIFSHPETQNRQRKMLKSMGRQTLTSLIGPSFNSGVTPVSLVQYHDPRQAAFQKYPISRDRCCLAGNQSEREQENIILATPLPFPLNPDYLLGHFAIPTTKCSTIKSVQCRQISSAQDSERKSYPPT